MKKIFFMTPNIESLCEQPIFTRIFKEYARTLHNYLYYKTGNTGLSEDLTQEAFTKLWQNCAAVLPKKAKGYVFKIANNLLINQFKHNKVVLKFQSIPTSDRSNESPEYLLEEKEFKQQLEKAISALPEKQRVVFLMSRIEKKTYQEIASFLGISKQAVEKRMYKALDQLRQLSNQIR